MRVLFASLASVGHTYPLIPLAIAAREAGHEVHFAAGAAVHAARRERTASVPPRRRLLRGVRRGSRTGLGPAPTRSGGARVGLPGAAVAARRAGIPGIWHGFGRMFPEGIGLELPTRNAEVVGRPHLDIWPPSLQDRGFLATERRIELRPVAFSTPAALPEWVSRRTSRPLIYLTLGTAFGTPELLRTAIAGLARLDAQVVVAADGCPGAARRDSRPRDRAPVGGAGGVVAVRRRGGAPRGSGTTLGALRGGRTAGDGAAGC
ncbi:hypothetical protein NKG94_26760 [Micromonospora sp. M12]